MNSWSLGYTNPNMHWRAGTHKTGEINGIPQSRGTLVATNGVLAIIRRDDGSLFHGHLDWFQADKNIPTPKTHAPKSTRKTPRSSKPTLDAYE